MDMENLMLSNKKKLDEMIPELKSNIEKGVEFVQKNGAQFD